MKITVLAAFLLVIVCSIRWAAAAGGMGIVMGKGDKSIRPWAFRMVLTVHFADGSTPDSNLDWAAATRQGAYAGVRFRF